MRGLQIQAPILKPDLHPRSLLHGDQPQGMQGGTVDKSFQSSPRRTLDFPKPEPTASGSGSNYDLGGRVYKNLSLNPPKPKSKLKPKSAQDSCQVQSRAAVVEARHVVPSADTRLDTSFPSNEQRAHPPQV